MKPYASSESDCQGGPKAEKMPQFHHTETIFSIVREIYGREHDDRMNDLDVNMAIRSIFLNATLRAAVHLGQDCEVNLRFVKNQRCHVDVDKLIVQQSLPVHQRQNLRLLRLCTLCWRNGR